MRGAVLAVGDELLLGDIVNSNAAWLGEALAGVGVSVVHSAMVGDHVGRLAQALRRALEDADVVVLTGGLGPTSDDITRDVVALVAGVPLERSAALETQLRERFAAYGIRELADPVLRQADVPRGARALDNSVGSAPGLRLELDGRLVVALPGPPHEMRAVATEHVLPELAERSGTVVITRTLRCSGTGESAVAQLVEAAVQVPAGVDLAYLAGSGIVRVRFTTAGDPALLEPLVRACAQVLGDAVFGEDEDTLPGVVGAALRARAQTVATAESLTGGLVGAALSELPGSSSTYRGGLVVYATDAKASLAGVPDDVLREHGAVSEQTAAALAQGCRDRFGAHWGVATTGVAGPDQQEGKPVGTVHVAVAGPAGADTAVRSVRVPGDRDRVRVLAVTAALDLLRRSVARTPLP